MKTPNTSANKLVAPFTRAVSGLGPVAETLSTRKQSAGQKVASVLGRNREASANRSSQMWQQLDQIQNLKGDNEAVLIRYRVPKRLPSVLVTDSPEGKPEITFSVSPNHGASSPQSVAFERQPEGNYTMMVHKYVDGEGLVAASADFEDLRTGRQDSILAMASAFNDAFAKQPLNFDVDGMPSPYHLG